jgi:hypothetical protein
MNPSARFCIAAAALAFCGQAAAQGMYKCKDGAGKITYAGNECHLLGLSSAGEVTGRASVQPALKVPPAPPPAAAAPAPDPAPAPAEKAGRAPDGEAVVGEDGRRCFKTARGSRCNDSGD